MKIPYKNVKGNVYQRQKYSGKITNALYKSFEKNINSNYEIFTFEDIKKKVFEILPQNISVKISSNNCKNFGGYIQYLYDKEGKAFCTEINLPSIQKSIRTIHLPILMHEFQHLTDQLCNPKYIARAQSIHKRKNFCINCDKFYYKYYYKPENYKTPKSKKETLELLKKRTLKFLKKYSTKDQIDFIQDSRYCLESEINAYLQENKFARKLKNKNLTIFKDSQKKIPKIYLFKEKIKLLKEIGFEIINSERKNFSQK